MDATSVSSLIGVLLAGFAGLAGLVAVRIGRGRIWAGPMCDAIAAGVLVSLLVGIVPRLIGNASVLLARFVPVLQPVEVRSLVASIGPLVIQNLAAAFVIGIYVVSLRSQRGREARRAAPVFALALSLTALADGVAAAASSLPATTPLAFNLLGGVALVHFCHGLALGGALATQSRAAFGWLASAALAGGVLNSLGAGLTSQLGFDQATVIAVPLLLCAVGLTVWSIATILGPGLGSNARRLPVAGFLGGLGLMLVAARLG